MKTETCALLAELNRVFYTQFADDFARTRRGWPPGFDRILPHLRPAANVLDLGCGNGRLLAFLLERGWRGHYLGLDSSQKLLAVAEEHARVALRACASTETDGPLAHFVQAELLTPGWSAAIGSYAPDAITALAVLHHIPAATNRGRFLADCGQLLRPGGVLILSTWQFMSAPRLRPRILPWPTVGLRDEDVEPGDYLLSWGQGATGRRYCAFISCDDLGELAARAGLAPVETFYADGREGNLNLYGVFQKPGGA
jgi:SAM-dependent methyltransferase